MKFILKFFMGLIFFSNQAVAWDGVASGKINLIQVTDSENYGLRVSLVNSSALCGNKHTWAYVNKSTSNYQTYVSVLLAAKMAGKSVTIYANKEKKSGKEYCHIGHIAMI